MSHSLVDFVDGIQLKWTVESAFLLMVCDLVLILDSSPCFHLELVGFEEDSFFTDGGIIVDGVKDRRVDECLKVKLRGGVVHTI